MQYVYILKSQKDPSKIYIGITHDLDKKIKQHNGTSSNSYIKSYAPWSMLIYTAFVKEENAIEFEKYLKTHSGRAFIKRHYANAL